MSTFQPKQSELGIVNGVPLPEMPEDLFIPPQALEICLETFTGPMDLLLYLIKKQNINILDLEVSKITDQYIDYINLMESLEIDLAGEYLTMAATLTEIKSRMLLPGPGKDEEEEDPKADLLRRLQEYGEIKCAAGVIERLPRVEREIHLLSVEKPVIEEDIPEVEVDLKEVLIAFSAVLRRAEMFSKHQIEYETLSVRDSMASILTKLNLHDGYLDFYDLFEAERGRKEIIVNFLALMELLRESLIDLVQAEPYSELHIKVVHSEIVGSLESQ